MKYYIKSLFIYIGFVFVSCTNLDEDPISVLSPEGFFSNANDVEAVISGAYSKLTGERAWSGELVQGLMVMSDMAAPGFPGVVPANIEIDGFTNLGPNNLFSFRTWNRCYEVITPANTAIQAARQIEASESIKLTLEAEARAIRAFAYFALVRSFGDAPYFEDPITDPKVAADIKKTPEAEIYAKIIEDLDFALVEGRLPDSYGGARNRITRGAAATILADVHLTRENWQAAYDNAKWVIDNRGTFNYGLEADYQDLYDVSKQDNTIEHIFNLDLVAEVRFRGTNSDNLSPLTGVRGAPGDTGGWSVVVPSMAVYDDWDDNDYRKSVAFDTFYIDQNENKIDFPDFPLSKRPHIAKYNRLIGFAQSGRGRNSNYNYPLYRYAEVLLLAAEALNELVGPNNETRGYVNEIRARARNGAIGGVPVTFPEDVPLGLSQDEFRDLVLEERRLELSFEFKRWYDIKRKRLGNTVFGSNSMEPHSGFNESIHYLLPIPQREIDVNPNITQNPGY
ncbi:MAG: RagB/SusD family nutrient uptake outer membrane protein [Flavobacteriaceae bacterium]